MPSLSRRPRRILLCHLAVLCSASLAAGYWQAVRPHHALAQGAGGSQTGLRTRIRPDSHPELTRALRAMETARLALRRCARDPDGHRDQALTALDTVVKETRAAQESFAKREQKTGK